MKKIAGAVALALVAGCTTTQESEMDQQVAALSPCEKVEALIKGHKQGFPHLRLTQTSSKYMEVWKARYHLVGDSCQVWSWGSGKYSYVCSLAEPSQEVAMEHLAKAKAATESCLASAGWSMKEGPRDMGAGTKVEFTKAGETTLVSMVAMSAAGIFKDEWRTYYFVGDPNDLK